MRNLNELIENIQKVIVNNTTNVPLRREVLKEFSKKGISGRVVTNIFEDLIDLEELTDIELIALAKGCHKSSKLEILNPEKYWTSMKLLEYDVYLEKQEHLIDVAEFQNCIKINAKEYFAIKNLKELSLFRRSRIVAYNKALQRKPKIVMLPNGTIITKKSVNLKAIKVLKQRFKNRDLKTTAISLCVLRQEDKKPIYSFEEYSGHSGIGTLKIKPIFDVTSENYAPLLIPDGYHRYSSGCDAYDECKKENIELDGSLGVFIYFMNTEEVRQYITDVFERSDTDEEWIQAMNQTDGNKTAQELISKVKIFNNGNEVAATFADMKTTKALTYNKLIVDAIERTTIVTGDELEVAEDTDKIAEILNLLFNRMEKEYGIDLKNSIYFQCNAFLGYITMADKLKNDKKYKQKILKIVQKLKEHEDGLVKLDLKRKNCDYKNIQDYFSAIAEV